MTTLINEAQERFGHLSHDELIQLAEKQRAELATARGKLGARTIESSRQQSRLCAERKARINNANTFLEHLDLPLLGPLATSSELEEQERIIQDHCIQLLPPFS